MKRTLAFFLVALSGAGLVLACSAPDKYIGGGRNFEWGTPVDVDSSTPADAGADQAVIPDVFVPPDTGTPKDTGVGG